MEAVGATSKTRCARGRTAGSRPTAGTARSSRTSFETEDAKREFLMGMHGFGADQLAAGRRPRSTSVAFRPAGRPGRRHGAPGDRRLPSAIRSCAAMVFDLPEAVPLAQRDRRRTRRSPTASRSSPATSSPIRCPPATCTPWAASCTTGPRRRSLKLLGANLRRACRRRRRC